VFFTESGSVAVEVALKMAIQYWRNKGRPEKKRIVYFRHGYHGDTFATMALCDPEEGMHALFAGSMPDQIMAELPTDESMRRAFDLLLETHRERLAAVIIEPLVQGAGGMKMHDAATTGLHRRGLPAPRSAADRRRDHDRLRPHGLHVRLRGSRPWCPTSSACRKR
jgi:adenosylmethionine-8-amino-7-oxononanoate aminotransferase